MRSIRQTLAQLIAGRNFVVNPAPRIKPRFSPETVERAAVSRISGRAPVSAKYVDTHRKLREEVGGGI